MLQKTIAKIHKNWMFRVFCVTNILFLFNLLNIPTYAQYCTSSGHDNTSEWISEVTLNTLNNLSGKNSNAYGDYTAKSTALFIGYNYTIYVNLGGGYNEYITGWIDFNNNLTFDPEEQILRASGMDSVSGTFKIPSNTVQDTVRMRVLMHYGSFTDDPCAMNLNYGETEDYTVMLVDNGMTPISDFSAINTFDCDGIVSFVNNTNGIVISSLWDFGDGNNSTDFSPVHTYISSGTFTISLISTNANGSDTLIKNNYVTTIVDSIIYCDTLLIPSDQEGPVQTSCRGVLYDAGGEFDYPSGMDGSIVIIPSGADAVKLTFATFDFEDTYDFLYVYDGPGVSSPLIGKYTGNSLPEGGIITSSGNSLTLRQTSDGGVENSGFKLTWDCITVTDKPTADFKTNKTFSCGNITFSDLSTNLPSSWLWDFGDGDTSTLKNPAHSYDSSGSYSVKLIATNSQGSDTVLKSGYILILTDTSACDTVIIPTTGIGVTQTNCTGNLLDNGSENDYSNNSNGFITLAPTSATIVKLTFSEFELENNYDYLYIYDGADTSKPLIGKFTGTSFPGNGTIYSTGNSVTLRFTSDGGVAKKGFSVYWECIMVDSAPVADFTSDTDSTCGPVYFTDLSTDWPDSWLWDFGDDSTSSLKNPMHRYTTPGIYTVSLIAGNSFGTDTLIKSNFITIVFDSTTICDTTIFPAQGIGVTQTSCSGLIMDDGLTGNYSDKSSGLITISPSNVDYITLTFSSFNTESNYDMLSIFDGADTSSSLIGSFSGNSLPNTDGIITSSGSSITLLFTSDNGTSFSGFQATWRCGMATNPPVTDFSADDSTDLCGVATFRDQSNEYPNRWLWDFGDGTTDTVKNPTHYYQTGGKYTVQLICSNRIGSDTIIKPDFVTVKPDSLVPSPSTCDPVLTAHCCGYGIQKVLIDTSAIVSFGLPNENKFQDFSCEKFFTVKEGIKYLFTVFTSMDQQENVRIWIDYNDNGSFEEPDELVLAVDNLTEEHSDSVKISGRSVLNKMLRMRVISDAADKPFPVACGPVINGEIEDYSIFIKPNPLPPVTDFLSNKTTACISTIRFTDLTKNAVRSWLWDFGDGTTDTTQNPSHAYLNPGQYTVKLTTANSVDTVTNTKTNFINILSGGPKPISCSPPTMAYCCQAGINMVRFNNIDVSTFDSSKEYHDYSCMINTDVLSGSDNFVLIKTNPELQENVRMWIDYNNDALFDPSSELVFSSDKKLKDHLGLVQISPMAIKNTMLRLRVSSEVFGIDPPSPCGTLKLGHAEDYGIIIYDNFDPPLPKFTTDDTITCSGIVRFTDKTANIPTSWLWNFGDGKTSTEKNPLHVYAQDGYYRIKLKTSNAFGSDSIEIDSMIHVTLNNIPKEPTCAPQTIDNCCGYGITGFTLNTITNFSADGSEGYQDFSCKYQSELLSGRIYTVTIETGTNNYQDVRVWIDYNNDGDFEDTLEQVFSVDKSKIFSDNFIVPVSAVADTLVRLRVSCDYEKSNQGPCTSPQLGQVEDYGIIIKSNTNPPVPDFIVDSDTTCNGTVQFTDVSLNGPTRWKWFFGDGKSDTIPNPLHVYADTGIYTVTLIAINKFGTDTIEKSGFIVYRCNVAMLYDSTMMITQCSGTLTDNGGGSNYQNIADDIVIIKPLSAIRVKLTFSTFNTESGYDFLYIYDGPDTTGPLIGKYSGASLPNGGIINSTGSSVTLHFTSDNFSSYSGFMLKWECAYPVPIPDFSVNTNAPCDGKVRFTDLSQLSPDSWLWNFGDGTFSTLQNPEHVYSFDSVYSVSLKCSNSFGYDTLIKNNFITVKKDTTLRTACTVNTLTTCCGFGINSFKLDVIDNVSENATEGYRDFTCNSTPALVVGKNYPFEIKLNPDSIYKENVKIWCDLNNDGMFSEPDELLFSKTELNGTVTGSIVIPDLNTIVYRKKIRLRVATASSSVFLLACKDINYGQAEDYSVILENPAVSPVADFSASTLTPYCSDTVYFTNQSSSATEFLWDFGDGTTDTTKHTYHVYSLEGTYTVKLIALNQSGSDTMKKINYLSVSCVMKMPKTGNTMLSSCTGKLFDDNGSGNYSSNTDGSVTISPPGAVTIKLSFTSFNYENTKDFLYIYDGPDKSSPLIGKYDGTSLPGGGIIQSTGSSVTIRQTTNVTVTKPGFELDWFCTGPRPVVDFTSIDTLTCNGLVSFTDLSTNTPTQWLWNFGDGTTSEEQNPVHAYQIEGNYTVILTATNNFGNNSVTKTNFIEVRKFSNPVKAQCKPATLSPCCNMGITKFNLAGINNVSSTSVENYRDFTCSQIAELNTYTYYTMSVSASDSAPAQNLMVLIDYNNDGVFDFSKEIIFSSGNFLKTVTTQIKITPDSSMVFDKLIRMRVMTDRKENPLFSCKNLQSGQAEDYGIIIRRNDLPPVSEFIYSYLDTCNGILKFTGLTQSADQWTWDFGDGGVSSQKAVTHAFRYAPSYNVKCITKNLFGADTLLMQIPSYRVFAGFSFSPAFPTMTPAKPALVSFLDLSNGSTEWLWDFGDGNSSMQQNPSNSYSQPGVFTVTQTISNGPCSSESQQKVVITMKSGIVEDFGDGNYLAIYPNPSSTGDLWLNYTNLKEEKVSLEISDNSGRQLFKKELTGDRNVTEQISLSGFNAGVYILKIYENGRVMYRKLVLL